MYTKLALTIAVGLLYYHSMVMSANNGCYGYSLHPDGELASVNLDASVYLDFIVWNSVKSSF